VSRVQSREMRLPTCGYRCRSLAHTHLKREQVDALIAVGEMEWVGRYCVVACYTEHKVWAKTKSGPVDTMQLVEPEVVLARRKR
jgi:hypothetical protein